MKLSEAKRALRGYLDQAALLRQIEEVEGRPLPLHWHKSAEAQVRAMVREIERCRNLGRTL